MGAAALTLASGWRGLLAEEPHPTVSPLNELVDEDEIELGRRFAEELEKEQTAFSSAQTYHYLDKVVAALAAKSQRPNLPWSIKLVNSHVPNALSLPGGFLYVNRGLIELLSSEDELAAALAREVGHVVARHTLNQLLITFAAHSTLKPVLDNLNRQNGVIEEVILKLGGAAPMLDLGRKTFSQKNEAEADLLGFYEMLRAGWDPNGLLKLFALLDGLEKLNAGTPIPFLSDRSPTQEREDAIRRELKLVTIPTGAATDSVNFQIFKSAMRLLPEKTKQAENIRPQSPK
ncbi:MAG: M48 family metalloprotease [Terracidiphilus sp.]